MLFSSAKQSAPSSALKILRNITLNFIVSFFFQTIHIHNQYICVRFLMLTSNPTFMEFVTQVTCLLASLFLVLEDTNLQLDQTKRKKVVLVLCLYQKTLATHADTVTKKGFMTSWWCKKGSCLNNSMRKHLGGNIDE